MKPVSINLKEKLSLFSDHWSPRIIARTNDYHLKLVKFAGEFVWHSHHETDETFLVIKGEMSIELPEGIVTLKEGELAVVPKGVEHKPFSREECHVLLIELQGTVNTGDSGGELTRNDPEWI